MIGLTSGLMMFTSVIAPFSTSMTTDTPALVSVHTETTQATTTLADTTTLSPNDFPTLEAYVRAYYKDTPELAEIARCESTFRQFDSNGKVLRGTVDRDDVGIMQINEHYHGDNAASLGYDIYTIQGNLAYAKVLYEKYGDSPWSSSEKCWGPSVVAMK